jgi:hypothetical protein
MAFPIPTLRFREFDSNGDPLSGGKVYTYLAGTTIPLATYTDPSEETPNTNPVILDSEGYADIYLGDAAYKFVVTDADDVVRYTRDNISPATGGGGGGGESPFAEHSITDGQSATALTGETIDFDDYSSAIYDAEVIRGTTVIANGQVFVQDLNGTGQIKVGVFTQNHGVTFSLSQVGTVGTLRAAASSGPGNGTIKLSRKLVPK